MTTSNEQMRNALQEAAQVFQTIPALIETCNEVHDQINETRFKCEQALAATPAAELGKQSEALKAIALVAHHGGFINLSESEALTLIRRITVQHHDWKQTVKETRVALKAIAEAEQAQPGKGES